jgi:hypothetical protein
MDICLNIKILWLFPQLIWYIVSLLFTYDLNLLIVKCFVLMFQDLVFFFFFLWVLKLFFVCTLCALCVSPLKPPSLSLSLCRLYWGLYDIYMAYKWITCGTYLWSDLWWETGFGPLFILCFYRWVIIFSGRKLEWFIIRSDKWGNMSHISVCCHVKWAVKWDMACTLKGKGD